MEAQKPESRFQRQARKHYQPDDIGVIVSSLETHVIIELRESR